MPDKKLTRDEVQRNLKIVGCIPAWISYKGVTQEQLANTLGVSKGIVSKWLNGIISVNSLNLTRIAEFFGVKVIDLFFMPGETPKSEALTQAAELIGDLSQEDLARWIEFGKGLRVTKKE